MMTFIAKQKQLQIIMSAGYVQSVEAFMDQIRKNVIDVIEAILQIILLKY